MVEAFAVPQPVYQYLQSSTGGINAVGNYSTGAGGSSGATFTLSPSTSEVYRVNRMLIHIQDTGIFDAEAYGARAALTNGVTVRIATDTGTVWDLTDGDPVKSNAQWGKLCYDVRTDAWGVGDVFLSARWTFANGGYPLRIDGTVGQRFEVYLQDSTTDLNSHQFYVHGHQEDEAYGESFNH